MKRGRFKPIETYLIFHMTTFGLILLHPSNTFDNPVYRTMSLISREEVWGLACMIIAIIQLTAMIMGSYKLKILGLAMTASLWSSIGTMFVIESIFNGYINTGVTYLCIACFSLWLAYTIGGQKHE